MANIKFIWEENEFKESYKMNELCILTFRMEKEYGFLLCAVNTESKLMFLNLLYKNLMTCETKLTLLNNEEIKMKTSHILKGRPIFPLINGKYPKKLDQSKKK